MVKQGLVFDYDLNANQEVKKGDVCIVCEKPLMCRWTDYSGEGVCLTCGCPYQLKWGNDEQKAKSKYPYINIKEEYILILKEYWQETNRFVFNGQSFRETTGQAEFSIWVDKNHPEIKQ